MSEGGLLTAISLAHASGYDGEDLAGSEDIVKPKLSAGTMGALAEFAKKHGYQIPE